jgi:hypothetical protein
MLVCNRETPILLIVFNCPELTQKVYEQIRKARPAKLYIAADGPRTPEEAEVCKKVRDTVQSNDWDCKVKTLFRDHNTGCGAAVHEALNWFFTHEPEGIVLEDDCLPADSFFGFCSAMLEKYRDDERIGHISGGNYQKGIIRGDGSYYFSAFTNVWGWAGWRRVWKDYDINIKSFPLFEKMNCIDKMPGHAPYKGYWRYYFGLYCNRRENSWDFQYSYLNLVNHRLSVIPNFNLVCNIGCNSQATHSRKNHPFADIPLKK